MKYLLPLLCTFQFAFGAYVLTENDVDFDRETGTITDYNIDSTDIVIPSSFDGVAIKRVGESGFRQNGLTSVTLPEGLEEIGKLAFNINNISSLEIPTSVRVIAGSAFSYNALTEIIIPATVDSLGSSAFYKNRLTSVELSESITEIPPLIFAENDLTEIAIPSSVTKIGLKAFHTNQLTAVTIPISVTVIDQQAFSDNKLTVISLPESLDTIGIGAFRSNYLTEIEIPSSVVHIGGGAFTKNSVTPSEAGVVYGKLSSGAVDSTTIVSYAGVSDTVDFLNDRVEKIARGAFSNCLIDSLKLPASLVTIEPHAFYNNELWSVKLPSPNFVTTIDSGAFDKSYYYTITFISHSDPLFSHYVDSDGEEYEIDDHMYHNHKDRAYYAVFRDSNDVSFIDESTVRNHSFSLLNNSIHFNNTVLHTVSIYSVRGQLLKEISGIEPAVSLNTFGLANGIYQIRVVQGANVFTGQFILK